jgi:hypothetical protein
MLTALLRPHRRRPTSATASRSTNVALRVFVQAIVFFLAGMVFGTDLGWADPLPQAWLERWKQPPAEDRPLQIVHGIPRNHASVEGMKYYANAGLGGVVCNVAFHDYLQSDENWQTLISGIDACKQLGLRVWLYDENGYPSGSAGGLVLKGHPEYEALALAYDASREEPLFVRPSYEHTHAASNYAALRRYPNLIDDRAMRRFLELTHDAYERHVGNYFGQSIEATFTDEPSLMAVNIGQLPDQQQKRVHVADPLDPNVKPLPSAPWCYDLPDRYRQRYGEDLLPQRRSLFVGDSDADRKVRRQFWALVADLINQRYFGAIQQWCYAHKLAASGHTLYEESILHHVPLEGNAIQALARMDIPGLDLLTSDPMVVIYCGWMTAGLPASAAVLNGTRRVMTEVSDFQQKMSDQGPAGLPEMQATAAWQAAWGVTEFTLYYAIGDRPPDAARAYGDYVGRLNALLRPAEMDQAVLLYYPIWDLWAEYRPMPERLSLEGQSQRAKCLVTSFNELGQRLQRSQIPFVMVDHKFLATAAVQPQGKLKISDHVFSSLVIPEGVELPAEAGQVVEKFRQSGGKVLVDGPDAASRSKEKLIEALQPAYRIVPASDEIALGQFLRDGRRILLVVNVGSKQYQGQLTGGRGPWQAADPATGAVTTLEVSAAGQTPLRLSARQAMLLVQ